MANCFLIRFPKDYPQERKDALIEKVYMQCFIPRYRFNDENQFEFMFERNDQTVESFRKRFDVPEEVEVIDSSRWITIEGWHKLFD